MSFSFSLTKLSKIEHSKQITILGSIRNFRLQNSRIFCERERRFERKVWNECRTRFTLEVQAYGLSRLPKTSENDCFAVYRNFKISPAIINDIKTCKTASFHPRSRPTNNEKDVYDFVIYSFSDS